MGGIYETMDCSEHLSIICGRNVDLWHKPFDQQEQSRTGQMSLFVVKLIVYTDLPNTLTAMLAERYEEESKG